MIEQTKTRAQEILEFKMIQSKQTFFFNLPLNLVEEGKWLLAVSLFDSVFKKTNENNSFSIIIPGRWGIPNYLEFKFIHKLKNLLKLKSENGIDIHVEEVRKRGIQIKIGDKELKLSDFDTSKNEIFEELKKVNYHDLEDMVKRMQLTYNEIMDVLDINYFPLERKGSSLKPVLYQISDINNALKGILSDNVKINVTMDEKIYISNLKTHQILIITNKSFFYTILVFTQSHQGPLNDIDGFYQLIAGFFKSDKPINITGIDKVHLKADCIRCSIMNVVREPILYSFALDQPPGRKIHKEPRIRLFKKLNKRVLSHITFYLEDDDYKPVDFNGETISFTCQLIEIYSFVFLYILLKNMNTSIYRSILQLFLNL